MLQKKAVDLQLQTDRVSFFLNYGAILIPEG